MYVSRPISPKKGAWLCVAIGLLGVIGWLYQAEYIFSRLNQKELHELGAFKERVGKLYTSEIDSKSRKTTFLEFEAEGKRFSLRCQRTWPTLCETPPSGWNLELDYVLTSPKDVPEFVVALREVGGRVVITSDTASQRFAPPSLWTFTAPMLLPTFFLPLAGFCFWRLGYGPTKIIIRRGRRIPKSSAK